MILLRTHAPWWVLPVVLFGFLGAFSLLQPPRHPALYGTGHRTRGRGIQVVAALVGGLIVVLGLWSVMMAGFRASGVPVPPPDLGARWPRELLRLLVTAAALELWLRGAAFAPIAEWQGRPAAVAITTALGMFLQAGLPPEAYAWTLVTGAAFGLLRSSTGSVGGLIIPHAVGVALFSAISAVR